MRQNPIYVLSHEPFLLFNDYYCARNVPERFDMPIFFRRLMVLIALAANAASPSFAVDSLSVSPPNPTTSDSIRLSIIPGNQECCSRYFHDSAAITPFNDSTITLVYSVPQILICVDTLCIPGMPGYPEKAVLRYKTGPLPAGKYNVYAQSQPQLCGDPDCTDAIRSIPAFVGTFTVSFPSATFFRKKSMPLEDIGKMSGNVRVYNIRGDIVSLNRTGASKRAPGVYFVRPSGRTAAKMKVWF